VGALDARYSAQISGALEMERTTVRDLVRPGAALTGVRPGATVGEVREATRRSGHLRILLGTGERISGVVHVRDTLTAPDEAAAAPFARPVFTLDAGTTVHVALTSMRETRNHLAVVSEAGAVVGVVTLADVLGRLFPQPATAAA
jgi:CBS domain containing-hemolysin-like protein